VDEERQHRLREPETANFELRALDQKLYATIVTMRRAYEEKLIALLDLGVAAAELEIHDTRMSGGGEVTCISAGGRPWPIGRCHG
jgi:hypothetical protein